MAVKARTWTTVDKEIADILATEKDAGKLSYRDIAKMTGMKHMRVSNIIHMVNGTPTVVEFIAICDAFGLDPAATLRQIIIKAAAEEDASVQDDDLDAPLTADEIMTLAANTDPNRDIEAETPRD